LPNVVGDYGAKVAPDYPTAWGGTEAGVVNAV